MSNVKVFVVALVAAFVLALVLDVLRRRAIDPVGAIGRAITPPMVLAAPAAPTPAAASGDAGQ